MKVFLGYYRVSTQQQGRSGLGLEAQRQLVREYVQRVGGELREAIGHEIESGKSRTRPRLAEALAYCKKHKATLIVGKLDRLARDVRLLLEIADSGVAVQFVDLPDIPEGPVGRFILTMFAAVAEFERGLISKRTKEGLAVARARGKKLGNPNLVSDNAEQRAAARAFAEGLRSMLEGFEREGLTQAQMVERLNAARVPAARGGRWSQTQLARVIARLREKPEPVSVYGFSVVRESRAKAVVAQ